jgi:hypothetical protein
MWSDPDDIDGWCVSNRGAGKFMILGWLFGANVVKDFNYLN